MVVEHIRLVVEDTLLIPYCLLVVGGMPLVLHQLLMVGHTQLVAKIVVLQLVAARTLLVVAYIPLLVFHTCHFGSNIKFDCDNGEVLMKQHNSCSD